MVTVPASIDLAGIGAVIVGVGAAIGAIIALLKFRREDTTQIVTQQSTLLQDMKSLNDELVEATARLRAERDELEREGAALRKERDKLAVNLTRAHSSVVDVETEAGTLRRQIVALEAEVAAARLEVETLRAEIKRLKDSNGTG